MIHKADGSGNAALPPQAMHRSSQAVAQVVRRTSSTVILVDVAISRACRCASCLTCSCRACRPNACMAEHSSEYACATWVNHNLRVCCFESQQIPWAYAKQRHECRKTITVSGTTCRIHAPYVQKCFSILSRRSVHWSVAMRSTESACSKHLIATYQSV